MIPVAQTDELSMKELVFYYDIVCPFAYMTSRLIESLARRNGAQIRWKPVLLGEYCRNIA